MSDQEALKELEDGIVRELEGAIEERLDDASTFLIEIQPPTSIVRAAAVAAAQVLMAFERGYRMGDYENGEGPTVEQEQDAEQAVADAAGLPGIDHVETVADWF